MFFLTNDESMRTLSLKLVIYLLDSPRGHQKIGFSLNLRILLSRSLTLPKL
jgi:hypothetical protein